MLPGPILFFFCHVSISDAPFIRGSTGLGPEGLDHPLEHKIKVHGSSIDKQIVEFQVRYQAWIRLVALEFSREKLLAQIKLEIIIATV
jgi:hypothetical protein